MNGYEVYELEGFWWCEVFGPGDILDHRAPFASYEEAVQYGRGHLRSKLPPRDQGNGLTPSRTPNLPRGEAVSVHRYETAMGLGEPLSERLAAMREEEK